MTKTEAEGTARSLEWKVVVGGDVRGWIAGSDNAFTRRLGVGPFVGFGAGTFRGHYGDTGYDGGNFAHVFFGLRFVYDTADT